MKKVIYVFILCLLNFLLYANVIIIPEDFPTIQAGINAATNGDTILVQPGTYNTDGLEIDEMMNRIAIEIPITVISTEGAEVTFIEGEADSGTGGCGEEAVRCAYLTNGAELSGFTLRNGFTKVSGHHSYERSGGGIFLHNGLVTDCIVSENTAENFGGGAICYSNGTITNSVFTNNNSIHNGGGIYLFSGGFVENCTIIGNHADEHGAGLYYWYFGTALNCIITENVSGNYGGGVYCYYGGTVNNSLIIHNTTNNFYGGGVYSYDYGTFNNCTICYNNSTGAYLYDGGVLNNCIIYFNSVFNHHNGDFYNCCTTPLPSGDGSDNIDNDPLFVNSDNDDFHLLENSLCINNGDTSIISWEFDLDGNPRVYNNIVDMGCFESSFSSMDSNFIGVLSEKIITYNYPNPFNPETTISFETTNLHSLARIEIFNMKGQRIRKFEMRNLKLGINDVIWNGKNDKGKIVSSGIYFYKLILDNEVVDSKKMILMK
ncbi:MAG: T9SS type A sorting domain-containing protein [Candidatus Cloacimonetes bacterium]|nr:T9SS type A sorting domain-containing protein [Candidatus Cloacimonadota bacterium]